MLQRFTNQLESSRLVTPGQTLVVAVSGGIDSVVLLDLLARLAQEWRLQLIVAHLDHRQRHNSSEDARFVGSLAAGYDAKYVLGQLPQAPMSEAQMRARRYDWLETMRRESDADAILTAHHLGDRLETAVWHAIRGSDRHGLTSLGLRNKYIIRPLIGFGKGDIISYAAARKLKWRDDPSNTDRRYTRNLIRHDLLHHAPVIDPYFHSNFTEWLDHLEELNSRIDTKLLALTERIAEPIEGGWAIKRSSFLRLNPLVQTNELAFLARSLTAGIGLSERNIESALDWCKAASSGSFSEALPGLLLIREYDSIKFVLRSATVSAANLEKAIQLSPDTPIMAGQFRLTLQPSKASRAQTFALTPQPYFIRNWLPGDRISPVGMSGSKKLQDVFSDSKIPRSHRLTWPLVVTARNEVALIPHLVQDRRFVPMGVDAPAHTLHVEVVQDV